MRQTWYGLSIGKTIYRINFNLMMISRSANYYPGSYITQVKAESAEDAMARFRQDLGYRIAVGVDPEKITSLHGL